MLIFVYWAILVFPLLTPPFQRGPRGLWERLKRVPLLGLTSISVIPLEVAISSLWMMERVPVHILLQAPLNIEFQTACSSFVISKEWQLIFIAVGLGVKATQFNPKLSSLFCYRSYHTCAVMSHVSISLSETLWIQALGLALAPSLTKLWSPFQLLLMKRSNIMKMTKEPHRSHFITDEKSVGSPWVISVLTMCPGSFSGDDFSTFPLTRTLSWKMRLEVGPMAHLGQIWEQVQSQVQTWIKRKF